MTTYDDLRDALTLFTEEAAAHVTELKEAADAENPVRLKKAADHLASAFETLQAALEDVDVDGAGEGDDEDAA